MHADLARLRAARWNDATRLAAPWPKFQRPRRAVGFVPVVATGGLGDAIMELDLARALSHEVDLPIRFYSRFAGALEALSHADRSRIVLTAEPFHGFDFWVKVNCMAWVNVEANFSGMPNVALDRVYASWSAFVARQPWDRLQRCHPHLDGEVAREAAILGLNRRTLPYAMLGLKPRELSRYYAYSRSPLEYNYLTIHDGYEAYLPSLSRATKTWRMDHWMTLVAKLKERWGVKIVQLGAKNSRPIRGVDVQLVNRTTLPEAIAILGGSLAHVDGDSGLTHAAAALGIPTVSMFGPTPLAFFGYAQHATLASDDCKECFWLTETWLNKCPRGFEGAPCMDSIKPGTVLKAVDGLLDNRFPYRRPGPDLNESPSLV